MLKPWPNGLASRASQRKFAKPELLAYGLAKGGQTDSQVGSYMRFYNSRLLAINLCRLALGGQTVRNLRLLASKFEVDQSQRKSSQVNASGWPNETQVARPKLASTCESVWPGLKTRSRTPKFCIKIHDRL